LTGVRIGIIIQSISAVILGFIIGFSASWKLSIVIVCFSPIMLLSGKLRAQKIQPAAEKKTKGDGSFIEQGGQVLNKLQQFIYL